MRRSLFIALGLCALIVAGCGGAKKTTNNSGNNNSNSKVEFINSNTLTAVLDRAESKDKVVFVDFYTTWCMPCKLMDEEVFTDNTTAAYLNKNFLNYKVNAEKGNGPNLATVYNVSVYPTLLFLDERGRVLERKEGAAFYTELKEMGDRAIAAANTVQ